VVGGWLAVVQYACGSSVIADKSEIDKASDNDRETGSKRATNSVR